MASTNSQLKNLGVVIAVFAIVGVGIGLTGYLSISDSLSGMQAGGGQGLGIAQMVAVLFGFMSMLIAFLLGPVVAAISGLLAGVAFRERGAGAFVGGAGSFVGFYVMVIVALIIIAAALPGGGNALGSQTSTILKAGVPSGIVGALSGAVGVDFGG